MKVSDFIDRFRNIGVKVNKVIVREFSFSPDTRQSVILLETDIYYQDRNNWSPDIKDFHYNPVKKLLTIYV